jgi:hypothetical protein
MSDVKGKLAWIGQSVTRKEDDRLLRGAGQFVDDVEAFGALHMTVLRCPYPHARLTRLDLSGARTFPGVRASSPRRTFSGAPSLFSSCAPFPTSRDSDITRRSRIAPSTRDSRWSRSSRRIATSPRTRSS